jgi:hypothetical protein
MTDAKIIPIAELSSAELHVDAIYQGGRKGNAGDDPFPALLNVSNQGGFRYRGNLAALEMLVLTSSFSDPDWPDALDRETSVLTYFGDNKRPGRGLHETPRHGNELLRRIFEHANAGGSQRAKVPPIFVFSNTGEWRDVMFLGLAVPGVSEHPASDDLVAIWRVSNALRFQNYRARFTIIDVPLVSRAWIQDLILGKAKSPHAPIPWKEWVETGRYQPLKSTRSIEYRKKSEQLPATAEGVAIINAIHNFFADRPHDFERCAAAIARLMLPDIAALDLTRPSRDGGRDAVGQLKLGRGPGTILVDFALEAKCYGLEHSVGVREMSRLISRLRHRQFGMLITTSYVDLQAYREIKEDQHPIIIISAVDIIELLKSGGHSDVNVVQAWLEREFAPPNENPS